MSSICLELVRMATSDDAARSNSSLTSGKIIASKPLFSGFLAIITICEASTQILTNFSQQFITFPYLFNGKKRSRKLAQQTYFTNSQNHLINIQIYLVSLNIRVWKRVEKALKQYGNAEARLFPHTTTTHHFSHATEEVRYIINNNIIGIIIK